MAAPGRGHLHEVGRGQDRRRRRADRADRGPRHVRGRFSAQGGGARRKSSRRLRRRPASTRRDPQRLVRADAATGRRTSRATRRRRRCKTSQASRCAGRRDRQRSSGPRPPRPRAMRRAPRAVRHPSRPMSIYAPGVAQPDDIPDDAMLPPGRGARASRLSQHRLSTRRSIGRPSRNSSAALPALGPMRGPQTTAAIMPAAVTPPATLACPLVSALDRWVSEGVQPAALRWFGAQVARSSRSRPIPAAAWSAPAASQYFRACLRQCARRRRLRRSPTGARSR